MEATTILTRGGRQPPGGRWGADTLDGGAGADILVGGIGDDRYVVDNTADVVTENAGEGTDVVLASVTYTLAANVENLTLTGTAVINATGNALNNVLTGNAGNNTLDGRAGADTLVGGAGDDSYVVDNLADMVAENANEGTDTVLSSVTHTLVANVEKLTLTGTAAINGAGNTLDNTLTGNSAANRLEGGAGADTLDGRAGADTLVGGTGDDRYVVENAADVVTENAGEGMDTVLSAVTHTLAANVENLTLTGSAAVNGTGNALNNVLTGNSGTNKLTGGAGDDTYVVDGAADTIVERANEGNDTVISSATHALATDVENLTLTGTTAINATGNALGNILNGNGAANRLEGGAGADSLTGGAGTDTMVGGTGGDSYYLARGDGADSVLDDDTTSGNTDKAFFGAGIDSDQLWFRQLANDLEVSVIGTGDRVTVANWYVGGRHRIEGFHTSNGRTLLESQVQNLVQAMASFAPPPMGETALRPAYANELSGVIAANWQ